MYIQKGKERNTLMARDEKVPARERTTYEIRACQFDKINKIYNYKRISSDLSTTKKHCAEHNTTEEKNKSKAVNLS